MPSESSPLGTFLGDTRNDAVSDLTRGREGIYWPWDCPVCEWEEGYIDCCGVGRRGSVAGGERIGFEARLRAVGFEGDMAARATTMMSSGSDIVVAGEGDRRAPISGSDAVRER